jgi:hypothetical protein
MNTQQLNSKITKKFEKQSTLNTVEGLDFTGENAPMSKETSDRELGD